MTQRPLGTPLLLLLGAAAAGCALRGDAGPSAPRVPAPAPHGALPTDAHMRWHAREFYAFVHFNMNTFTGVEWGHGIESPESFNPTEFDAGQWCALFAECGLTGVIITAKHHDGFCLWPSAFTEHDVASSPWRGGKGDVIAELAEACREHGLFLGIYISPWDRNNPIYGRDDEAYNAYFIGQLEELLTSYGEVAEVWWDGANGDRNNPDKHQEYDWAAFNETVMRLQPDSVTFGPPYANMPVGVRWVGNERGYAGATQWSTYPMGVPERAGELNVGVEGADRWFPAESDVSIRPGWYWTPESDGRVKTVEELLDIYYASVGHNTNLLLNFPVDSRGLVHENDAAALRRMTAIVRATFEEDLLAGGRAASEDTRGGDPSFGAARAIDGDRTTYWATDDGRTAGQLTVTLDGPRPMNRVVLQEAVELGQRVRSWTIEARVDGRWQLAAEGTTIGYKRIARFPTVVADALRLAITDSRACPTIATLSAHLAPPEVTILAESRVFLGATSVTLAADAPGCTIHYTLDGSAPTLSSPVYRGPLELTSSATIRAAAAREGRLSPIVAALEVVGHSALSLRAPLAGPAATAPGLRVERYDGGWQTLDQMRTRTPVSTGSAPTFDIAERLTPDHAALAFTAELSVPRDGVYEFFTSSDDGSRLYVGDALVVENDGLHGMVEASGHVAVRAGRHRLRVEYFNATGGAGLRVEMSGPAAPRGPIPGDWLRH